MVGVKSGVNKPCVVKWFKTGAVYEYKFFDQDLEAVSKAQEILEAFNELGRIDQNLCLNLPEVWTFTPDSGRWAGKMVLVEPFISRYRRFNSNTGVVTGSDPWSKAMQALSHFSYHHSGGQLVLCDLQGTICSGGKGAVLTDPVILSSTRSYGVTDLGPQGISTFFARHNCSRFCMGHWETPKVTKIYYEASEGTTMELTQPERPPRLLDQPKICEGSEDEQDAEHFILEDYYNESDDEDDSDESWSTVSTHS
eukprot:jgi/Botrbrau1/7974/Bobra.384_2s0002.1